jgi:ABC-type transport system involved in cytochrome bd biosynthesis fused ATPase/permease subunit
MMALILIVLVVILILVVVVLSYKHKAEQQAHYAAIQKTISEAALSQVQRRTELDQSLTALETRQRQETIDETHPQHLAARTDLDNDWSDDSGLYGNTAAASDDNNSAAAAGSTGTPGD